MIAMQVVACCVHSVWSAVSVQDCNVQGTCPTQSNGLNLLQAKVSSDQVNVDGKERHDEVEEKQFGGEGSDCKAWCATNPHHWGNKCNWVACSACDDCTPKCQAWCPGNQNSWATKCGWLNCGGCDDCASPSTSYVKEEDVSCGWGNGCTGNAQAYCYETSDPDASYVINGYSKVMPNVDRESAEVTCGAVCSACEGCLGFNWIASLHGISNGCWFRQNPTCAVNPKVNRDCWAAVVRD